MKANIKSKTSVKKLENTVYLSIGMIVKNESRYLRRCLEAMSELIKDTNAELIIVDTGSTDDTVEIAKQFTDHVYHFEWTGDFSEARNETLRYATGKWYMFVDADEIFESTNGLAEFVTSNQPKEVAYGAYTMRNILHRDRNDHVDATLFRVHKMFPGIEFEHPIHENLVMRPGFAAVFLNDVLCVHYGYSDELTKAQSEQKERRNKEMLENALKKDPDNTHYLLHYIREFRKVDSEFESQMEYIERGVLASKDKDNHYAFISNKILTLYKYNEYQRGKQAYLDFVESHSELCFSDIDVSFFTGIHAFLRREYEVAIEALDRYIKAYDLFEKNTIATPDFAFNPQTRMTTGFKIEAIVTLAFCKNKSGDNSDMQKLTDLVDFSKTTLVKNSASGFDPFLLYCTQSKDYSQLPKVYRQLLNSPSLLNFFEKRISDVTNDPTARAEIAKLFTTVFKGNETPFVAMQFVLTGSKNYKTLFKLNKEDLKVISPDLLMSMLENNESISEINKCLPVGTYFDSCAAVTAKRYENFDRIVYDYIKKNPRPDELLELHIYLSLCFVANRNGMLEPQELHILFTKYVESLYDEMKIIYQPTMFRPEHMGLLPEKYRFAFRMNEALSAEKNGDYVTAVKALKVSLTIQNEFVSNIEHYLSVLITQQNSSGLSSEEKSEFDLLADTLIMKAQEFIANGMIPEATMIIDQLSQIIPNDTRITELKKQLNR